MACKKRSSSVFQRSGLDYLALVLPQAGLVLILLVCYTTLASPTAVDSGFTFHGVHASFARPGQRFRPSASPRAALLHRYTLCCSAHGVVARVVTTRRGAKP